LERLLQQLPLPSFRRFEDNPNLRGVDAYDKVGESSFTEFEEGS
jgi:hypothetical protein